MLLLRDALPFQVTEVFLVERQSGLLLQYLSHDPEAGEDSDLVSGMLTAIRDFAQDTFGREREGQLDEVQYGSHRIVIEASRRVYLAAVIDGIEPSGFRADLREQVMRIENAYAEILARYDGDSSRFDAFKPVLSELLNTPGPNEPVRKDGLERSQKRLFILLAGLLLACLLLISLGGLLAQPAMVDLLR